MKKKVLLTFFSILFTLMLTVKVDGLCTSKKYSNLKTIAYRAEVSYEFVNEKNNSYFLLTVTNVDDKILVSFQNQIYEPKDGVVKINTRLSGGTTYQVNLLGGYDSACVEEFLYAKKITVPMYNVYSERKECIEYEEFYMCNKWYAGEIPSDVIFEDELRKYVKSITAEEPKNDDNGGKNIIEIIVEFYLDHAIITVPLTIALIGYGIYTFVVRMIRRKNRVKLN